MSQDSFRVKRSLNVQPLASPTLTEQGDLGVDSATGKLQLNNGTTVSPVVTEAHSATLTNKTIDASANTISNIVNSNIAAGAAIALNKLANITAGSVLMGNASNVPTATALSGDITVDSSGVTAISSGVIVDADINASAAIAYSKLALTNSIVNADIATAAAIAYSKLALANSIVNADIATGAAIDRAKIAAGTANHVLINDGSGNLSSEALLDRTRGGTGVSSTATFPTSGTIATDTNTLTFTNKTLDAPVIDNGADFIEESTLSSPASGRRRLGLKTDGKLYLRDSSGNEVAVGTGSGGGINYIDNPDAEANTAGWATYADAAGTQPVDGTGGTANITWTRDTTTPIRDTAQFLLTKDAANRQGQGVSYDFTIDRADQAKRLTISFDYQVASGTYADGDIGVYIVDVTNGTVIQPAGFQVQNISGVTGKELATFQTASNSTSYRLCLHVASTSTSAYTLRVDNVQVGPVNATFSTPVTDFGNQYPVTSDITTNATIGSVQRRVGDSIQVIGTILFSGPNIQGSNAIIFPGSIRIDAAKEPLNSTVRKIVGTWQARNAGTGATATGAVVFATGVVGTATVFMEGFNPAANTPFTIAANHTVTFDYTVPVVGWSSSAQVVSDSSEGRVVAARVAKNANQTIATTSQTAITFQNASVDTHGGWDGTNYTVRVPGYYRVSVRARIDTASTTNAKYLYIQRNLGTTAWQFFTTFGGPPFMAVEDVILCNAGDTLRITGTRDVGGDFIIVGNVDNTQLSISLIQGSTTLLGGETVAAALSVSATNAANNTDTLVSFTTTDYVYAGSTTASRITVPMSGLYQISAMVGWTINATNSRRLRILRNGGELTEITQTTYAGNPFIQHINRSVRLLAGDFIEIQIWQNSGAALALDGSTHNFLEVRRVGN